MGEKLKVNLFDSTFSHTMRQYGFDTASAERRPREIEWVREQMVFKGPTVFTDRLLDSSLVDEVTTEVKLAWLIEPRSIDPTSYETIKAVEDKFDYIFTHDVELLKRSNKYRRSLVGSSRVPNEMWGIHNKDKNLSIIASDKKLTVGHRLRHDVISNIRGKTDIDLWGSGYRVFNSKLEPLKPYRYSISIMNYKTDNYFTEILIDNFLLGTIPIFWGCQNIGEFFNVEGIISFNDTSELISILPTVTEENYNTRLNATNDNLEIAKQYVSTDDMIAREIKRLQK